MITIVDYGAGNLGSIQNMLKKIGVESTITSDKSKIESAEKLILPGVGSFDYGMQQLNERDLIQVLNQKVLVNKTPILGICLGVQLFTKKSEEGKIDGLGWFDADTVKFNFPAESHLKIPNMGWQEVIIKKQSKLTQNLPDDARFYFVHSYHLSAKENDVILTANYGYEYACGLEKENIVGVQFHPEKSHKFGMTILKNFAENY
jgi:imidazole glycerol-phosphate synthase subunit HisH